MSAKNIYHDGVVRALIADGWTITDDPLKLKCGKREFFVDLGAERPAIGAEKEGRRIAVEVQSFLGRSTIRDLEEALGQYDLYRAILAETDPDRSSYLAVPRWVGEGVLTEPVGQLVINRLHVRFVVFDAVTERIVQWIE